MKTVIDPVEQVLNFVALALRSFSGARSHTCTFLSLLNRNVVAFKLLIINY
jgi:hypothetical protein